MSILFILQLAAVSLICFMICGPALTDGRAYGEITAVIDASASMRAVDSDPGTGGKTRFERALDDVMDVAGRLSRGQKMSVLIAGDAVLPAVSHSDDRAEIKKALRDMKMGKDTSVLGFPERMQARLVKLLPAKLVMATWCRQQKQPREG